MITRTWRVAAMATLGMLCTGALQAQSPAASEWTFLGAAQPQVSSLAVSPVNPDFMLARVGDHSALPTSRTAWVSDDGGTNWRPLADTGAWFGRQMAFTSDGRGLVPDEGAVHVSQLDGLWWQPFVPVNAPPVAFGDVAVGAGDAVYASAAETGGGGYYTWGVYQLDLDSDQMHPRQPPVPAGHQTIKLLAADPAQAGVVVVVSDLMANPWPQDPRLWVSDDGGLTWADRSEAMPSRDLASLRFTDTGWLGTFGFDNTGGNPGVYRSLDQGESWLPLAPYLPDEITDAAQDPSDPQRLVATGWDGLHLSEDGGFSWQSGVAGSAGRHLSGVQFAPGGGLLVHEFNVGLLHADAALQSLSRLGPQLGAMVTTSLAINPADAADAAALGRTNHHAFVSSDDGGLSWTQDTGATPYQARQVAYGPDGRLYLVGRTYDRSLLVREGDGSWTGLMPFTGSGSDLHALAFGATAQHLLVSARVQVGSTSQNQILRSTDGGATWTLAHASPLPSRDVSQVLNASGPAGGRFLGVLADSVLHDPVLLLSSDGGQAFSPAGAGLPSGLRGVQVCTTGAGAPRAYLSAVQDNQQRLLRSDDDGLTWQHTDWLPGWPGPYIDHVTALWCDPDRADVVVMGGRDGSVLRSTDAGDSFALLGDDLAERTHQVNAFAASPAGLLYAATNEGAWAVALPDDAPVGPENLVVTTTGSHARPWITLTWDGGQAQVMIRRNGSLLGVVANTGHFQDRPSPRDLPASYQVCNGDGSQCTETTAAMR